MAENPSGPALVHSSLQARQIILEGSGSPAWHPTIPSRPERLQAHLEGAFAGWQLGAASRGRQSGVTPCRA